MKIFIYSYGIPSKQDLMYGIFAFDQAKGLSSLGHEVYFLVLDLRSLRRKRKLFFDLYEKENIKVCHLSIPAGVMPGKIHDQIDYLFLKLLYKKANKLYGIPDLIHSHFLRQSYSISRLISKRGIRLFCSIHDSHLMSGVNDLDKSKLLRIQSNSTILTVSPNLNEELKINGIKSIIVNNMIDEKFFHYNSERKTFCRNFAVTAGALIGRKGMVELVNVWKELPNSITTKLIILGDGPEKKKLSELIIKYNLSHRIQLIGAYNRFQFAEYLNHSKYFLLASKKESFGVVYAEALMHGVPVIATKCGGPENLVNCSNGILVEVDNHNELLNAIVLMERNYNSYDYFSISNEVKNSFGIKAVALRLTEVYSGSLLKNI